MKPITCDVCSKQCRKNEGYILRTVEVISSPGYWEYVFSNADLLIPNPVNFSGDEDQILRDIIQKVLIISDFKSGWWVRDTCMKRLSDIDLEIPRSLAKAYMKSETDAKKVQAFVKSVPPDEGDVAVATKVAIQAFENVHSWHFSSKFSEFDYMVELMASGLLNGQFPGSDSR